MRHALQLLAIALAAAVALLAAHPRPAHAQSSGFMLDMSTMLAPSVASNSPHLAPPDTGFQIDTNAVARQQRRELRRQASTADTPLIAATNAFTRAIDDWHERIFRWFDDSVRAADTWFLDADDTYTNELSSCRLTLQGRVGGRSNESDFELKPKFRADLALPGLHDRVDLFVDNLGRTALPGDDPLTADHDTRVGVRTTLADWTDFDVGARYSDGFKAYAELSARGQLGSSTNYLRLQPFVGYDTEAEFYQQTSLIYRRDLSSNLVVRLNAAEGWENDVPGVRFETTARVAIPLAAHGRGWVFRASAFPRTLHDSTFIDNYILNFGWNDILYRRWIYYSVTPQLDFAKEDDHHPHASLRLSVTILFGGKIGSII